MSVKTFALQNAKKLPCPTCCRFFCRDRDMTLVDGYYVCESIFWESTTCNFSFPDGLSEEEINKKAAEHIRTIGERV
jgi:hypothetical protein